MLNVNEKLDNMEGTEKGDNLEQDTQNQSEFYSWDYNVNFFGVGREAED